MNLLIAGAGGHGRVVADTAAATGAWSEVAFVDDRYMPTTSSTPELWPMVGNLSQMSSLKSRYEACVVAVGDATLRLRLIDEALSIGFIVPVVIHPRACVSPRAHIAAGTVICAGAVVCIGADVGSGCIINHGATVDHDCMLGNGVHVCPGAHIAGDVRVGMRTWIGIGAAVTQGIRIGDDAMVGAGSVCIHDVSDGSTIVGVPGRPLPR